MNCLKVKRYNFKLVNMHYLTIDCTYPDHNEFLTILVYTLCHTLLLLCHNYWPCHSLYCIGYCSFYHSSLAHTLQKRSYNHLIASLTFSIIAYSYFNFVKVNKQCIIIIHCAFFDIVSIIIVLLNKVL